MSLAEPVREPVPDAAEAGTCFPLEVMAERAFSLEDRESAERGEWG